MYLLSVPFCLTLIRFSVSSDLQYHINCEEDENGLLEITLSGMEGPLQVQLNCSNGDFTFDLQPYDEVVQLATFNDWTNTEITYPEDICVLTVTEEENLQSYRIYAEDGGVPVIDDIQSCRYRVGLDSPAFNYSIECPANVDDTFSVHLENTGDVWLLIAVRCWNDWFNFNIAPGFTAIMQAVFLTWTDEGKVYPPETCVFIDIDSRQQGAIFFGMESDWDYKRNVDGCTASFGSDTPMENHSTTCPDALGDPFSIDLVNSGDVWLFVNVSCWNDYFAYFLEPNTTKTLPASMIDLYNLSAVYPPDTCVFSVWGDHTQDVQIYTEEPDWDYTLRSLTCPYSIGATVPALLNHTQCPEDSNGPIYITLENVGDVVLSTELWCWNDWYSYTLGPKTSVTIEGAFFDWTNLNQTFEEDICIFQEFGHHLQAVELYAEESDLDYLHRVLECEYSVGSAVPAITYTTDCTPDETDVFDIHLENTGDVWLYIDLWCWNDWFEYYIEPHSSLVVPAKFTEWTDPHLVFPENVCALQDGGDHLQEFGIYIEESDWDYTFKYFSCDYSVGGVEPKVKYYLECPVDGNQTFPVNLENIGNVWLLVELSCWNGVKSLHLEPEANTTFDAVYRHWTNPSQEYPGHVCVFSATLSTIQEVELVGFEPDYDIGQDVISCNTSFGDHLPAASHYTDCTPDERGIFKVHLVNNQDAWLYVELHCWNDVVTVNLEPKSNMSVPAVFNEWPNLNQIFPENGCAFEDWEGYQDLVVYSEDPNFERTSETLTCPYRIGKSAPAVNHYTDCSIGEGIFNVTLQNVGNYWVYVQLECTNGFQEYYLQPHSIQMVLSAIETSHWQALPSDVCLFVDGYPAYLGVYNEEPDWDSSYFELMCSLGNRRLRDWEARLSWRKLARRSALSGKRERR